jgi:hypothetical protein
LCCSKIKLRSFLSLYQLVLFYSSSYSSFLFMLVLLLSWVGSWRISWCFFLDLMNNFIVSFFTTLPHPAVMVLVPMSAIGLAISWIIPLL